MQQVIVLILSLALQVVCGKGITTKTGKGSIDGYGGGIKGAKDRSRGLGSKVGSSDFLHDLGNAFGHANLESPTRIGSSLGARPFPDDSLGFSDSPALGTYGQNTGTGLGKSKGLNIGLQGTLGSAKGYRGTNDLSTGENIKVKAGGNLSPRLKSFAPTGNIGSGYDNSGGQIGFGNNDGFGKAGRSGYSSNSFGNNRIPLSNLGNNVHSVSPNSNLNVDRIGFGDNSFGRSSLPTGITGSGRAGYDNNRLAGTFVGQTQPRGLSNTRRLNNNNNVLPVSFRTPTQGIDPNNKNGHSSTDLQFDSFGNAGNFGISGQPHSTTGSRIPFTNNRRPYPINTGTGTSFGRSGTFTPVQSRGYSDTGNTIGNSGRPIGIIGSGQSTVYGSGSGTGTFGSRGRTHGLSDPNQRTNFGNIGGYQNKNNFGTRAPANSIVSPGQTYGTGSNVGFNTNVQPRGLGNARQTGYDNGLGITDQQGYRNTGQTFGSNNPSGFGTSGPSGYDNRQTGIGNVVQPHGLNGQQIGLGRSSQLRGLSNVGQPGYVGGQQTGFGRISQPSVISTGQKGYNNAGVQTGRIGVNQPPIISAGQQGYGNTVPQTGFGSVGQPNVISTGQQGYGNTAPQAGLGSVSQPHIISTGQQDYLNTRPQTGFGSISQPRLISTGQQGYDNTGPQAGLGGVSQPRLISTGQQDYGNTGLQTGFRSVSQPRLISTGQQSYRNTGPQNGFGNVNQPHVISAGQRGYGGTGQQSGFGAVSQPRGSLTGSSTGYNDRRQTGFGRISQPQLSSTGQGYGQQTGLGNANQPHGVSTRFGTQPQGSLGRLGQPQVIGTTGHQVYGRRGPQIGFVQSSQPRGIINSGRTGYGNRQQTSFRNVGRPNQGLNSGTGYNSRPSSFGNGFSTTG